MAKPILDEALWAVLELLLPPDPPRPRGGRPRIPHRQVLTGILFLLRSGIPWELPPKRGGPATGANPTDPGKAGTKRHLVVEGQGLPLAVKVTAANAHDGPIF